MQREFKPTYDCSVETALTIASPLQQILLRGDVVTPDIDTIESLSKDLSHMSIARHASGVFRNIRDASYANRNVYGDAVVDETFIGDLLHETNRKPIVTNTDSDGTLRGLLFELERGTEDGLSEMWKVVGQGYSSVYLLAARGNLQEQKMLAILRGSDVDTSAEQTPWFIKIGFSDKETADSVRETLRLKSEQDIETILEPTEILSLPGIFQEAKDYKDFIEFIRQKHFLADQSIGETLEKYEDEVRQLDDETYFIDSLIGKTHNNNIPLLTVVGENTRYNSELLFKGALSSIESRLVAGKFIVQTAACFADGMEWLQIEEVKEEAIEIIDECLDSVKAASMEKIKQKSLL